LASTRCASKRLGSALYVELPGNPCAAAIPFSQIARSVLRRAAGLAEEPDTWLPAVAGFTCNRTSGRREYAPVTWVGCDPFGRPVLMRLDQGASASMSPMVRAMGIAVSAPEMDVVRTGQSRSVEPVFD